MNNLRDEEAAGLIALLGGAFSLVIGLAIAAVFCWFLFDALRRVPAEHRKMEPGLIWLIMIPCLGLFWMFKALPDTSRSFKSYFDATGDTSVGDCNEQLAWWTAGVVAGSAVLSFVPILNMAVCLAGPAGLVLWIVYLVRVTQLKNRIPLGA